METELRAGGSENLYFLESRQPDAHFSRTMFSKLEWDWRRNIPNELGLAIIGPEGTTFFGFTPGAVVTRKTPRFLVLPASPANGLIQRP